MVRPDDIALLRVPGRPALHADLLLVAVSSPDPERNRYDSALYRVPLDGSGPARWTWDDGDSEPAFSPDGRWLAFLRKVGDKRLPQVHVMPVGGGGARALTDVPLGASAPVWSPDSATIAFTARIPEPGRYGTEGDGGTPEAAEEAPRRITSLTYRLDDVGYLGDQAARLCTVGVADDAGGHVELTDGRADAREPVWTPDGEHLVFVAPLEFSGDTTEDAVYAVPALGGKPTLVARTGGWAQWPAVTDDGLVVFSATHDARDSGEANNNGLWAVLFRAGETGTPHRLTDAATVDLDPGSGPPVPRRGQVLVAVRNRGAVELRHVPLDAVEATLDELPLVAGEGATVKSFTADGSRIAAVVSTPDSPGEVVLSVDDGTRSLTDFGAPLRAAGLRPAEEIHATAPDGYPVHGWLVLPEGEGPHPVVLAIHGGPFAQYGWTFFDEAQVYAAAGYAVVLPNPRGGAGYGEAHGRAIVRAMGTVDADDVLAALDAALARPECDAGRVGVMGGSYGGFLTSWLAAHHGDRFAAAWSERAVNAWDSFAGSSDIGWFFGESYVGTDPEAQRAASPLTYADRVRIPFAVVHSEHDLRCPFEQGQRMFVALRRAGVDAEMLVFPGEGHELTRSGRPRHRIQRFRAVLDWWDRHLRSSGDQPSSV